MYASPVSLACRSFIQLNRAVEMQNTDLQEIIGDLMFNVTECIAPRDGMGVTYLLSFYTRAR